MRYTTVYSGTPYGRDGEQGGETTMPARMAQRTLNPGQTLTAYRASDAEQSTPVARWTCGADGKVRKVELGR